MSSLFDLVADIRGFTGALGQEVKAFEETQAPHDRMRALKAIAHLEKLVTELGNRVGGAPVKMEGDK